MNNKNYIDNSKIKQILIYIEPKLAAVLSRRPVGTNVFLTRRQRIS